jgi:SET domain-containing protein
VLHHGLRTAELTRAAVIRTAGEYRLVTTEPVAANMYLFSLDGEVSGTPTRYTVQIDESRHIDLPDECRIEEVLDRFFWRFMNHSCEPNTMIRGRDVISLVPIEPWQEITFHYGSTEYEMAEPFECRCGNRRCEGLIRGFRYLSQASRERLRPLLATHLLSILDGKLAEQ